MPLLPLEPFVFRDELLYQIAAEDGAEWWVLHSKPRTEKWLARHLLHREIPFFLPLYKRRWCSRGRMFSSYLPLFPGYIFMFGDDEARIHALETKRVARCLPGVDQHQLRTDLAQVHQLMASGAPLAPEERMNPGMWAEIRNGPLAGLEGKILRRGKNLRFLVEVNFLQRGASVEIDGFMLRPLGARSNVANS